MCRSSARAVEEESLGEAEAQREALDIIQAGQRDVCFQCGKADTLTHIWPRRCEDREEKVDQLKAVLSAESFL